MRKVETVTVTVSTPNDAQLATEPKGYKKKLVPVSLVGETKTFVYPS